ncbi:uncharacterized protein NPIL_123601 [Nephila pilipes]|uniref:Uncharacterized protein n=1 Tax=Nephila pilipes TaxID=299642 RepID=A0A8X6TG07_NEPPI|nr:uncharacterized protein NPIL_123601 [Nephila pilipes]
MVASWRVKDGKGIRKELITSSYNEYKVSRISFDYHEGTQIPTINTNYVYAIRFVGSGAEAGRMYCAVMNLPQSPTRFAPYNKRLFNTAKLVSEEAMQNATQETIREDESYKNITVTR